MIKQEIIIAHKYRVECFDKAGRLKWVDEVENRVPTAGLNKYLDATLKTGLAAPAWYVGLIGASVIDAAIDSADNTLTSASNPWTSADVGSPIIVRGAGAAGADLVTTIASYTGAGEVELTDAAGTTVSDAECAWGCRAADTMASHAPWAEVTPYSNATRPAFTPGTISGGSVDNSGSKAAFTINATDNVFGCFMADSSTKGETASTLLGMGVFAGASRSVLSGDTLNVTITATMAAA
jgi:hypothetical protein